MTTDFFLGGRVQAVQPRSGFRSGTDAVFLAAAVPCRAGERVLELGCGAGVAALCLNARTGAHVTGVDLQAAYVALAKRNCVDRDIAILQGDTADLPRAVRDQSFDHVMFNPPYYAAGAGMPAHDQGREQALRENLPLSTWFETALRRLRPGGSLTVIAASDRLQDMLVAAGSVLGSLRILPLAGRAGRDAKRLVLQGVKGGRTPLKLMAPLVLHPAVSHADDGGAFTPEADAILRGGAALVLGEGRTP